MEGYEPLLESMTNDPKDRHVLATAVQSQSSLLVTYNRRDFPPEALHPWGVKIQGPSTFLRRLFDLEPGMFIAKLQEQAVDVGSTFPRLLQSLAKNAPSFVEYLCQDQDLDFVEIRRQP